jgi:hypothetical protein
MYEAQQYLARAGAWRGKRRKHVNHFLACQYFLFDVLLFLQNADLVESKEAFHSSN